MANNPLYFIYIYKDNLNTFDMDAQSSLWSKYKQVNAVTKHNRKKVTMLFETKL